MKSSREWIKSLFDRQPPRKVLFRVDAGRIPGLSFGHLARCLILSKIVKEFYRSENVFLMRDYAEGINHALQAGETVKILPKEILPLDEQTTILSVANELEPDWMIIDLPYSDLDTSYYPTLRLQGTKILFIDDSRFINPGVDVVLNSSIFAPAKTGKFSDEKTTYFLGPEFLIFDEALKDATPIRKESIINIILTFGGSDPTGLTKKVLTTLLGEQWPQFFFRVILGPGYADPISAITLLNGHEQHFGVEVKPLNIFSFFQGCDFAVCAGGRTMYELYYLDKIYLPIASSDHEAKVIAEFIRRKITSYGLTSWNPTVFIRTFKEMLKMFHPF